MKVNIKRIDKNLPVPTYQTKGSVGFDLYTRVEAKIKPFEIVLIPVNLIVKIPKGYALFLMSRSSTPIKKGIMVANGVGLIDQDYHGEEDELRLQVINVTRKAIKVPKGERLGQGLFVKVGIAKFSETQKMKKKSRGGFGTTG